MIDLNGHLHDAQTTETLGQALASLRPASAVVQLHGDLGAGKSTLARCCAHSASPGRFAARHTPWSNAIR